MAQRTFGTTDRRAKGLHEFTLEGVGQLDGETWSETFRCIPKAPSAALDDLARSVGQDEKGQLIFNQVSLLRFFRQVMHPEDETKFDALVHDKNRAVEIEELGEVMFWLAEVYTERPTVPSSSSAPGQSNGDGSSAGG